MAHSRHNMPKGQGVQKFVWRH